MEEYRARKTTLYVIAPRTHLVGDMPRAAPREGRKGAGGGGIPGWAGGVVVVSAIDFFFVSDFRPRPGALFSFVVRFFVRDVASGSGGEHVAADPPHGSAFRDPTSDR